MNYLPYPVGSIVWLHQVKYLVDAITVHGPDPLYSLIGHEELESKGYGIAWVEHVKLAPIEQPSIASWTMLCEAREYNEEEF